MNADPAVTPSYTRNFKLADGTALTLPDEANEVWPFLATHDLTRCQAPGLDLGGQQLSGLLWQGANLQGANLRDTVCQGTGFNDALLSNACLDGARLSRADFRTATLVGATLRAVRLAHTDLHLAALGNTDFTEATVEDCTMTVANPLAPGLCFDRAKLHRVTIVGPLPECGGPLRLCGASFRQANVKQLSLKHVALPQAVFADAIVQGWSVDDLDLSHTDLRGAQITGWGFRRLALSGAQLRGLQLEAAAFRTLVFPPPERTPYATAFPTAFPTAFRCKADVQELHVLRRFLEAETPKAALPARDGLDQALFEMWLERALLGQDLLALVRVRERETLDAILTAASHFALEQ